MDQLSSAELPAEFRDAPDSLEAPAKEQSKLARLCQQTSSVLASVLPAPFGGHKRSILCQFFGQVPMVASQQEGKNKHQQQQQQGQHFRAPPESIAILQQPPRPPMALIPSGRHPIQLVIEQHQRQIAAQSVAASLQAARPMQARAPIVEPAPQQTRDLQSSASILDHTYHQTVEAPSTVLSLNLAKQLNGSKYSSPSSGSDSFIPLKVGHSVPGAAKQPALSKGSSGPVGGGWRIFDQPPKEIHQDGFEARHAATFAVPKTNNTNALEVSADKALKSDGISSNRSVQNPNEMPNYWLSGKQLFLGKPPGFDLSKEKNVSVSSTTLGKRSEVFKSSTESMGIAVTHPPLVRLNQTSTENSLKPQTSPSPVPLNSTMNNARKTDLKQNEKREELVIASINNLTRIAFGNQLRDTVKVINRLIDQQSGIFDANKSAKVVNETLVTSESQKVRVTPAKKSSESVQPSAISRQKQITNSTTASGPDFRRGKSAYKKQTTKKLDKSTRSSTTRKPQTSQRPQSSAKQNSTDNPRARSRYLSLESRRLSSLPAKSVSRSLLLDHSSPLPTLPVTEFKRDKTPWRQVSSTMAPLGVTEVSKPKLLHKSTAKFSSSDLWTSASVGSATTKKWSQRRDIAETKSTVHDKLANFANSIEGKPIDPLRRPDKKLDSLTALKMSILSTSTQTPPPTTFTSAKAQQSRWVPATTLALNRPPTTMSSLSSTTASQQQKASQETTTPMPSQSTSFNDLNEARASYTISKYTTHLNEANELLASTRRFFTQSLPQIANTGEFFSAETISSWPERYQTMVDQQRQTTPSLMQPETTRRNGETYDTSVQSRHRLDTTASLGSITISQLPAGVTVLPANHKLTSLPADLIATTSSLMTNQPKQSSTYTLVGSTSENELLSSPADTATVDQLMATQTTSLPMDSFPRIPPNTDKSSLLTNSTSSLSASNLRPPYLDGAMNASSSDPLTLSRPYISRKLYEMLMPSTKNFVGAQNPLNQQRVNLSALRFLAQNLLTNSSDKSSSLSIDDLDITDGERNSTGAHKLLDLIGLPAASSYYGSLFQNGSSSDDKSQKSMLSKTSDFLNDLRQLERKRAAAILAAIRYQVPGPLVRPWDPTSDASLTAGRSTNERLDKEADDESPDTRLWSSLLFGPASRAIRTAINRQRLVPRDELELRLNRNVPMVSDRQDESLDIREIPIEPLPQYSVAAEELQGQFDKSFNFTHPLNNQTAPSADLDDSKLLRSKATEKQEHNKEVEVYPKYIRLNDYQTASSVKPDSLRTKSMLSLLNSSAVGARLKNNLAKIRSSMANGTEPDEEYSSVGSRNASKLNVLEHKESFDCHGKSAGFYPDTSSACQTFYHCSSTGHLLSFDCPQQSRFDERSLKCGPWFEVPCAVSKKLYDG